MVEQNSVCLVIIDGWGHSESKKNYQGDVPTTDRNDTHLDAISHARTLFYDNLLIKHGFLTLCASGLAVGLPENTIGNSQVGHITIGAGRCVKQPLLKIWDLFRNKEIPKILKEKGLFKRTQNSLHLIGLASDGGVHSHIDHLFLLIDIFSSSQAYDKIVLHLITDGRDTHPMSCLRYIRRISEHIEMINRKLNIDLIKIGSISGRWYTMDRDNNRERYECAFQVMTGDAHIQVMTGDAHTLDDTSITDFNKIERYVLDCYEKNPTDEMIAPFLVNINCKIKKQDRIFFFNFRIDRMKQITKYFLLSGYKNIYTMTDYGINDEISVIVCDEIIKDTLAEVISKNGLKQAHIAETEKFAHVTYFFNGGVEKEFEGEERILIESEKISSFKDRPTMRAKEITQKAIEKMDDSIPFIVLNFANPDMVGHTGDFQATVTACETIDKCLSDLAHAAERYSYNLLITSDHGNAERMSDENGPVTKHTTSRVPFIAIGRDIKLKSFHEDTNRKESLTLSSVAPTVLKIMKIPQPSSMTGKSLIQFKYE